MDLIYLLRSIPRTIIPSFVYRWILNLIQSIDAQVSFDLTDINAVLKVGGNNIGGKDYQCVLLGGNDWSVYYTSVTFDF